MLDVALVALTIAVFAVLALVLRGWSGCERREPDRPGPGRPADRLPRGGPALPGAVLMSDTAAGLLTVLALVVVLGVTHVPLGDYMARVYSATTHWRAERVLYRVCRIDPDADQTWATYALSVLGFSLASVLFLFGLQRVQHVLPLVAGLHGGGAAPGVEHRGVVRDQHELAELLRRVDHGLPGPDGRPGGAELRLRRGRHGRRGRAGARLRPVADQPGRQLLGRPGPRLRADPAAAERSSRRCS